MEGVYIFLALIVMTVVTFLIASIVLKRKQIKQIEDKLRTHGTLLESNSKRFDYTWVLENKTYLIKLFYTPSAKEVSFNSKMHWQVATNGGKKLFATNGFADLEGNKLIVVYPTPGKMVKHINENEVVFVKPTMDIFGMNAVLTGQIDDLV